MPAKKTATKATAKKAAKKAASPKKTAATSESPAKKSAPAKKKSEPAKATVVPTIEAIARQAYLNYLHRVQNGLPGDSHGDWIAAEKELAQG
jgi:hypothetical protein